MDGRVLGVDPGLNLTGYGVIEVRGERPDIVEAGVVRTPSSGTMNERLQAVYDGICDVIASLRPTAFALEQLFSHYQRPRTAILMGHARGVICLAATQAGLATFNYAPTQVKKILTGNGRAPKDQVQMAVQRELQLKELPEPPDVADALAVALCHHYLKERAPIVTTG
jgi:crossover junction endodeoxyribonuclease RuvC